MQRVRYVHPAKICEQLTWPITEPGKSLKRTGFGIGGRHGLRASFWPASLHNESARHALRSADTYL